MAIDINIQYESRAVTDSDCYENPYSQMIYLIGMDDDLKNATAPGFDMPVEERPELPPMNIGDSVVIPFGATKYSYDEETKNYAETHTWATAWVVYDDKMEYQPWVAEGGFTSKNLNDWRVNLSNKEGTVYGPCTRFVISSIDRGDKVLSWNDVWHVIHMIITACSEADASDENENLHYAFLIDADTIEKPYTPEGENVSYETEDDTTVNISVPANE